MSYLTARRFTAAVAAVAIASAAVGCGAASSNNMMANPQMMTPKSGGGQGSGSQSGKQSGKQDLAAVGETTFISAGCGACHELKAAGTTSKIGPTLNGVGADPAAAIKSQIVDPNAEVIPGYKANVMPATFGTSLTGKEINGLVAYIKKVGS